MPRHSRLSTFKTLKFSFECDFIELPRKSFELRFSTTSLLNYFVLQLDLGTFKVLVKNSFLIDYRNEGWTQCRVLDRLIQPGEQVNFDEH